MTDRALPCAAFPARCTEELAVWIVRLHGDHIPAKEITCARLRLIDTAALILVGAETEAACIAIEVAMRNGAEVVDDAKSASVVGHVGGWRSAWTAFAHGVIAHCRDFDDTFPDSVVHPGSIVIPVAMALAEEVGANDDEILTAIVVGYEVAARLGRAGGRHLLARGFHASGVYGPIVAAAVAARLLRLDSSQTSQAMGLASSMAGGLLEFLVNGSWSKWLHVGWSAFGGVVAAQMAQKGFRGPDSALEGAKGLYAAFVGSEHAHLDELRHGLGQQWFAGTALPKYFPCAHVIQPYIVGALDFRARGLRIDDIDRIVCMIAPWAVSLVCEPLAGKRNPITEMDVMASLPFLVGAALVDGAVTLDHLHEVQRGRPDLLTAAARVSYATQTTPGASSAGSIEIHLFNGDVHSCKVGEIGLDAERLASKFRDLAAIKRSQHSVEAFAQVAMGRSVGIVDAWRNLLTPKL